MPFPGFRLPLNLPPSFIGLTVAAGGLGCKDSHPASSLPRHLLPLDLQVLLLNLAPASEPSRQDICVCEESKEPVGNPQWKSGI